MLLEKGKPHLRNGGRGWQGRNRRKVDVLTEQRDAALAEIERLTELLSIRHQKPAARSAQDTLF